MVIPTIPSEFPFWQDYTRCDYFRTSVKIREADIYKVVGGINGFDRVRFNLMTITYLDFCESSRGLTETHLSLHLTTVTGPSYSINLQLS